MATIRETYTISEELVKKLNQYSAYSLIPTSKLVTKLIKEYLDNLKIFDNK